MNIRTLVGNGILAALYIAVSMLIQYHLALRMYSFVFQRCLIILLYLIRKQFTELY